MGLGSDPRPRPWADEHVVTPLVAVIGEALVDLVPNGPDGGYRASPGGSPFNVAVGLARLGNRTSLMARFAHDRYGRMLRAAATAERIDLAAAAQASERTTLAIASMDETGSVAYDFDADGTADWQWTAAELSRLRPDTEVLHFGSIASWTPPGSERIAERVVTTRACGGVLISYDPNVRPVLLGARGRGVELVERSVRYAHVVKASREDLECLYPDLAADDVGARWSGLGPGVVVVTDGAHGASAYRETRPPLHRPGRRVAVVDTIGAGDAFTAGLLTGLIRRCLHGAGRLAEVSDETLARIIDDAVLISAVTCERAGADPPRLEELQPRLDWSKL
jgi:fructokinase